MQVLITNLIIWIIPVKAHNVRNIFVRKDVSNPDEVKIFWQLQPWPSHWRIRHFRELVPVPSSTELNFNKKRFELRCCCVLSEYPFSKFSLTTEMLVRLTQSEEGCCGCCCCCCFLLFIAINAEMLVWLGARDIGWIFSLFHTFNLWVIISQ